MSEKRDYSDIMHCSRPELHRPRMPMSERAAQFAPFSALSGYQGADRGKRQACGAAP